MRTAQNGARGKIEGELKQKLMELRSCGAAELMELRS